MTTFTRVLVAVDFGDASASAVGLGGALARAGGWPLTLLHAESTDAPPYFTPALVKTLEAEAQAIRRRAEAYLGDFGRRHTATPFDVVVESRVATEAILHASRAGDLVVMGTHGRRGPSRWWLGSVAERVLRSTEVPLLVTHAGEARMTKGLLYLAQGVTPTRTRELAQRVAAAVGGTLVEADGGDPREARERTGATWAAVPVPVPRTSPWWSQVGEPLVASCRIPVLFVPETRETQS
jgi:nucleotide-binding universal stress UspA family protein